MFYFNSRKRLILITKLGSFFRAFLNLIPGNTEENLENSVINRSSSDSAAA